MWSIDDRGARLMVVRIASPMTDEEQAAFGAALAGKVRSVETQVLLCTDLRGADTFSPAIADRFVAMMRADNPKLLRSVFLVGGTATFGLQVERLIREAGHPHRRAFRTTDALLAFLDDVASPEERAAIAAFFTG